MKIICYGDSNTYGYDPRSPLGERYDPECRWVDILASTTGWEVLNCGLNGREIPDKPVRIGEDADLLVVMLGTNDLLQFWPLAAAAEKMSRFISGLSVERSRILLVAPPPMVRGAWVEDEELIRDSRELAHAYRNTAQALGIGFADAGNWGVSVSHDGVHFSENGHRAFAEGLLCHIRENIL